MYFAIFLKAFHLKEQYLDKWFWKVKNLSVNLTEALNMQIVEKPKSPTYPMEEKKEKPVLIPEQKSQPKKIEEEKIENQPTKIQEEKSGPTPKPLESLPQQSSFSPAQKFSSPPYLLEHPVALRSTYSDYRKFYYENKYSEFPPQIRFYKGSTFEPDYSTFAKNIIGTVDYIWFMQLFSFLYFK